jgi:hypothetical protein
MLPRSILVLATVAAVGSAGLSAPAFAFGPPPIPHGSPGGFGGLHPPGGLAGLHPGALGGFHPGGLDLRQAGRGSAVAARGARGAGG